MYLFFSLFNSPYLKYNNGDEKEDKNESSTIHYLLSYFFITGIL